jgi:heme exporter protein A
MSSSTLNNSLSVIDLGCIRGDKILFKQLSFTLDSGKLLFVQGENGSGKTTLLRTLCGLSIPAAGAIKWNQQKIKELAEEYYSQLLYIGHLPAIKDDLTAIENILFSLSLSGYTVNREQAIVALDALGIARCANLPSRALSQGQKRRVALAQLWLHDNPEQTPLWILDEPFASLDITMINNLTQHIEKYVKNGGAVIFTSHQTPAFDAQLVQPIHLSSHA